MSTSPRPPAIYSALIRLSRNYRSASRKGCLQLLGVGDVRGDDRPCRSEELAQLAAVRAGQEDVVDHRQHRAMAIELHRHVGVVEGATI